MKMNIITDGREKDSLIDLEDTSEGNDKLTSKLSGLCKFFYIELQIVF